jgi:hypothetical protein
MTVGTVAVHAAATYSGRYKVVESTAHDARRLGLAIDGGHIGTGFRVEGAVMRAYPGQWPLARWPVKAGMLLLALAFFPQTFLSTAPSLFHPTKNNARGERGPS